MLKNFNYLTKSFHMNARVILYWENLLDYLVIILWCDYVMYFVWQESV